MPASPEEKAHDIEDFGAFLESLEEQGFDFAVIGGCAVGAYGRLRGEEILTSDLDIFAEPETLNAIVAWAARSGIQVLKTPKPRSIPVALLRWEGKDINILTDSIGLPEPREAASRARTFTLSRCGGIEVEVADPIDLLRNKVLVDRPKDRPHVEVLRRFVEEEVVEAFRTGAGTRTRIRPAQAYLEAIRSRTLPAELAARLLPFARLPVDFRFLLHVVPEEAQARDLLERARARPEVAGILGELEEILRSRRLGRTPSARPRVPARRRGMARHRGTGRRRGTRRR